MRVFWTIYRRQLSYWFYSPLIYVIFAAAWMVAGLSFGRLVAQSAQERLMTGDILFGSLFFWGMVLISITLITMGVLAEERKSGSIEMLLTAPVSDAQIVLGKYVAALTCYALLCLPLYLFLPVLHYVEPKALLPDLFPVYNGYAIVLLLGACYTAFGVMISAMVKSPIAAACLCLTGLSLTFFIDIFRYVLPQGAGHLVFDYFSTTRHIADFSLGMFDTRPLVLYVSGTILFLFITVKLLGARHWR